MGKKEREFEGEEVCVWGDQGKAGFARENRAWRAAKVAMDTLYDNNTTIHLGVVGRMGASMAAGKCAPAE